MDINSELRLELYIVFKEAVVDGIKAVSDHDISKGQDWLYWKPHRDYPTMRKVGDANWPSFSTYDGPRDYGEIFNKNDFAQQNVTK